MELPKPALKAMVQWVLEAWVEAMAEEEDCSRYESEEFCKLDPPSYQGVVTLHHLGARHDMSRTRPSRTQCLQCLVT